MKAINFLIVLALLTVCSCASVPQKMNNLINEAQINQKNYSEDDWRKFSLQYEQLYREYENSDKASYTKEEREMMLRSMGEYHALLIANEVNSSVNLLKDITKDFSSYIEGFTEGISKQTNEEDSASQSLEDVISNIGDEISKIVSKEK